MEGIRSKNIWENLAKMCVKTQRIDVPQPLEALRVFLLLAQGRAVFTPQSLDDGLA